jgi:hypothetical protein
VKALAAAALLALVGAAPAPTLVLNGDGLSAGGKTIRFGATTKAQAIAFVTAVLGKPSESGTHGDCGQADIQTYATFKGDFQLSFVKGKFVGWTADAAGLKTGKGIGVGSTVAAVRKAYPDIDLNPSDEENGGLGASFQREGGPDGWIEDVKPASKVVGLFSGTTCIVG